MSSPPRPDERPDNNKWCPLCGEWKETSAGPVAEIEDSENRSESIYCPDCGAKLLESP
jgi:hypothetical protein